MTHRSHLFIALFAVFMITQCSSVLAAYVEPAGWADLPVEELSAVHGDNSARLQAAVDRATVNGGRIRLKKGTYELANVVLKSNVHLEVEAGTVIAPYAGGSGTVNIFSVGGGPDAEVQHVSFRGIGGRFSINYPSDFTRNSRAFAVSNIDNLLIRDIDITENYTKFSAIALLLPGGSTLKSHRAKNVTVTQVSLLHSSYGYSLVQANTGQDMLFSHLIATDAGVTVRVETDLESNNLYNIGVDNISIQNVTNVNGNAAVFMQPHSIANGDVRVDGVVAIESSAGVVIFKNNGRFPDLPDGSFGSGSYVRNVSVVYGMDTPMNYARIKYMPPSLIPLAQREPDGAPSAYRGPSATAVINLLPDQVSVNYSDITHSGPNLSEYLKIVEIERRNGSSGLLHWDNFISRYSLSGSPTIDSDSDGLNDWGEYLKGGNPTNSAHRGVPPVINPYAGNIVFSLVGDRHVSCEILTNTNLMSNTWDTNTTIQVTTDNGIMNSYTNTINVAEDQLFIKLIVE
ncbi:right-handed parallel beta-helix repeat-containing protein [Pontiella sulfatireligans]|uniref:Iota-carrageenase n=1 Tax=Pontiella sulfatireligans TaxID=2750658 RepID=A0A6C2UJJ5_9BACT|nr:hypothetical protein [Pontiella sulfatireligans]VGO20395.1 Iota-carrageenase [Pontiella sulfatireligans]